MMEDDLELAEIDDNQGMDKTAEELGEEKKYDQSDPAQVSKDNYVISTCASNTVELLLSGHL